MKKKYSIPINLLAEMFDYDPEAGTLKRKLRPRWRFKSQRSYEAHNKKVGEDVGYVSHGRPEVRINGIGVAKTDICFAMVNGYWPDVTKGSSLKIKDIEEVSTSDLRKTPLLRNNKSGVSGLSQDKDGKWTAQITVDGKQKSIAKSPDKSYVLDKLEAAKLENNYPAQPVPDNPQLNIDVLWRVYYE